MRRLILAALSITAIILVIGAVLQLGQKPIELHSGSSLSAPLPHEFQLVTAASADETGARTLPLYYGNWQVFETPVAAGCTWTMSVKPVPF